MDIIKIDLNEIQLKGLKVQEYLTLLFLYVTKTNNKEYTQFIKQFGPVSIKIMERLQELAYIKIPDANDFKTYVLREPTFLLFEGNVNLFVRWMNTFPIKTPSGRYLSPVGDKTIKAKTLRKKWDKLFGVDRMLKLKVIDTLQAEVDWRKKNGSMEYIHNSETWLNQGDWENYEYLLTAYKARQTKVNEDFI